MNPDLLKNKIGIVGAGSWGTALAKLLADKGFVPDLWVFEPEVKKQIKEQRENKIFLPKIKLPNNINPSNDLEYVVKKKDIILIVVPSHLMRDTSKKIKEFISNNTIIVTASKGIENKTYLVMTQILEQILNNINKKNLAVLSGPSFAREVANKIPTVVAAASYSRQTARYVQDVFSCPTFRVYINDDPIAAQIGGAMKNVIAIAAGICDGMKMGLNPRAALITRGLTEMNRLATKLGANPLAISGLAGAGDLLLTCTGDLSRNYTLGKQIGQGKKLDYIISEMRMVAEGIKTTRSVYNLAKKLDIDLPVCNEVYFVLFENLPVKQTIGRLMNRELKHEFDNLPHNI